MFQLIISILAIVLAVALAGISISYIGSAFSNGSETAQYATLVNEGVQIEGAMTLYRAQEGEPATALSDLAPNYLKQVPADFDTEATGSYVVKSVDVGVAVCDASEDTLTSVDTVADVVAAGGTDGGVGNLNTNSAIHGCIKASDGNVFFYAL